MTENKLGRVGVIARFKPLHNGAYAMLEAVCENANEVIIGIGSANKYSLRNPFTAKESEDMVRLTLEQKFSNYSIIHIPDFAQIPEYSDGKKWKEYVIEKFGKFEDLNEEDWQKSFDLTFMSAVRFIRGSLPYLKKSGQARIINIASLSAHQPSFPGLNLHYGMAKAGMVNLTKNLANDFGRYGVTVNAVCPSTLAGGGWDQNIKNRAEREKITPEESEKVMRLEENRKSPLGRMGELKDAADLVVFLASANAKFLTGHCYNIDGGITRSVK